MVFLYLDPAAGGMVIQTIVAAVIALPFILKSQITKRISRLRGRFGTKVSDKPIQSQD